MAPTDTSGTAVQQGIMSTLSVTTTLHLSAGLMMAEMFLRNPRLWSQIGLNAIAGALGVMTVGVGFAIHRPKVLSPRLLLGATSRRLRRLADAAIAPTGAEVRRDPSAGAGPALQRPSRRIMVLGGRRLGRRHKFG